MALTRKDYAGGEAALRRGCAFWSRIRGVSLVPYKLLPNSMCMWSGRQQIQLSLAEQLLPCPQTPTHPHGPTPASAGMQLDMGAPARETCRSRASLPGIFLCLSWSKPREYHKNRLLQLGLERNLLFWQRNFFLEVYGLARRCVG